MDHIYLLHYFSRYQWNDKEFRETTAFKTEYAAVQYALANIPEDYDRVGPCEWKHQNSDSCYKIEKVEIKG